MYTWIIEWRIIMKNKYWDLKNDKIDLVYLWVNGNDENWQKKKQDFLIKFGLAEKEANAKCRFADNDELKYSLRSVEKFAPWVNKIFIVSDDQIPDWLNLSNPKIRMVFHHEIMPDSALPCFSSPAIEYCICNIEELSEFFIYANDDAFFADKTAPEFFFAKDKFPICRFGKRLSKSNYGKSFYQRLVINAQRLIATYFRIEYKNIPHHNIDAYRKSDLINFNQKFKEIVADTVNSHFRSSSNIERVAYLYYMCAINHGHFKKISRIDSALPLKEKIINFLTKNYKKDSIYLFPHNRNYRERIEKLKPNLFCINDSEESTDEDRLCVKEFLKEYFPEKSSFEN